MRPMITAIGLLSILACSPSADTDAGSKSANTAAPSSSEAPAQAATDVRGEVVSYEVAGVPLTGYLAYDANKQGRRPGVLVIHEWWGHNDYARKRADMLAEMGYTAFALDMYGDGKLAEHPADAQKFAMEIIGNMDTGLARIAAARELLVKHPTTDPEKIAAIGYCFGGGLVLHLARIGAGYDAVASFHGGLEPLAPAGPGIADTRIFVAHGAEDSFVSPEAFEAFRKEMAEAPADLTLVTYPGAKHSFTNPEATEIGKKFDLPVEYNEQADRESWAELERFLAETFAK